MVVQRAAISVVQYVVVGQRTAGVHIDRAVVRNDIRLAGEVGYCRAIVQRALVV